MSAYAYGIMDRVFGGLYCPVLEDPLYFHDKVSAYSFFFPDIPPKPPVSSSASYFECGGFFCFVFLGLDENSSYEYTIGESLTGRIGRTPVVVPKDGIDGNVSVTIVGVNLCGEKSAPLNLTAELNGMYWNPCYMHLCSLSPQSSYVD